MVVKLLLAALVVFGGARVLVPGGILYQMQRRCALQGMDHSLLGSRASLFHLLRFCVRVQPLHEQPIVGAALAQGFLQALGPVWG